MTHFEGASGFGNNNNQDSSERRGKALHAEREYRGEQLSERALEMLMLDREKLQSEIARLEKNLEEGTTHTMKMGGRDEQLRQLSIEVGRQLTAEIASLKEKLQVLEEHIVQGGGNPEALQ